MSKKTLNKTNLEALGAAQLAELLMEVSAGSADIKRRLRLELSHSLGASELARDVRKRLLSLRKSTGFVGWRRRKGLIKDLDTQVVMITEKIAPEDPTIAFDLLWEFTGIAPSVYERVDDSRGDVGDVFRAAIRRFEDIAPRAFLDPDALAERVWAAVQNNGYGEWDGIIGLMAPSLGAPGLALLKAKAIAYGAAPVAPDPGDHAAIRFLRGLRGGDSYAADRKARFLNGLLQEIAAAAGDTKAYIAQYSEEDLKRKDISAEVAMLLLDDGRAEDALTLLQQADPDGRAFGQEAWDGAFVACLTAVGREGDAQTHRWASFAATLNPEPLRAYLKRLPDFEDVEAEGKAKDLVLNFPDVSAALEFCLSWPDLLTAAELIGARADEIDGNRYALLTPAAEALRARHPRAAVLLWRAMIGYTLGHGLSSRYSHAADHLSDCAALDAEITDFGPFPSHEQFLHSLRTRHDRKTSFWAKVS